MSSRTCFVSTRPFRLLPWWQKPDEKWGETPCAFIELKPGKTATAEEIIAYCRERLARYRAPRFVVFEELPKTSTGKVQKFILREMAKKV